MEGIGGVIRKKADEKPNKRLHSDAHVLADEISSYFNERKLFGMYLGVIKRLGVPKARAIFSAVKSDMKADNPRKMFMWLARNPGEDPLKNPEKPLE
jgi:hypothetical protein